MHLSPFKDNFIKDPHWPFGERLPSSSIGFQACGPTNHKCIQSAKFASNLIDRTNIIKNNISTNAKIAKILFILFYSFQIFGKQYLALLASAIKTSYLPFGGNGSTWKEQSVESEVRCFDCWRKSCPNTSAVMIAHGHVSQIYLIPVLFDLK